eukprot:gnl/Trimastix_PCT/3567.p1 GENE.gnl/Trimastix_PCT/3567~~gnl/Trimastix_PCT/3567.p1  ORF type:complete len:395 (-),score=25.93 gnl/Trimastix_PCT/3567:32-1180(-)
MAQSLSTSGIRCSTLLLQFLNGFFGLCGFALVGLGIYAAVATKYWLCYIIMAIGLFVALVSIFGICGARAKDKASCQRVVLMLYFFIVLLTILVVAFISCMALISKEWLVQFVQKHVSLFIKAFASLHKQYGDGYEFSVHVAQVLNAKMYIVAIVGFVIAACLILGLVLSAYILSLLSVVRSSFVMQNFVLLVAGGFITGSAIYEMVTNPAFRGHWTTIVLCAVGGFVTLISFMGCIGACLRTRCLVLFYGFILILIATGCLILGVVLFTTNAAQLAVKHPEVLDWIRKLLGSAAKKWTTAQFDSYVVKFLHASLEFLALGLICFFAFLLWSIFASFYLFVKARKQQARPDDFELAPPGQETFDPYAYKRVTTPYTKMSGSR